MSFVVLNYDILYIFSLETAPNISIKETFKYLMNQLLCSRTQRQLELNQNGILVNIFLDHPDEDAELSQLSLIKPYTYDVQARFVFLFEFRFYK